MSQVRLADFVFDKLSKAGVRHVFVVTGGGAMHLNDALAKQQNIQYVCNHHEQACAISAEGYARMSGKIGVLCVTSGPGGINALNGVFGAWTDSIPMLILSGQSKSETTMHAHSLSGRLRQLGDQESDIIKMVKSITKYAVLVDDPANIRYHLERALHLAGSGRKGPCWLDIPVDVQSALIDPEALASYDAAEDAVTMERDLKTKTSLVLEKIRNAKRPVIMLGSGVRLAGAVEQFREVAQKLGIPVTTAWTAHDAIATDHPLNCGRPGTVGDRHGNFTVQNSDLLLVLGCKLSIRQVSYNWKSFAKKAFTIQVDIDPAEMQKPTVQPNLPIVADVGDFLEELDRQLNASRWDAQQHLDWLEWCQARKVRYDLRRAYPETSHGNLNPYWFIHSLFQELAEDDVVVCGNGSACVIPFQIGSIRGRQRMWTNAGCASMGYDLPAAIGAAIAHEQGRVICIAGDGSILMNVQELQTLSNLKLDLKIFVLNNDGYVSMRSTQRAFFGRLIGESPRTGVSLPNFTAVAQAFGIPSLRIDADNYKDELRRVFSSKGPVLCEVIVDPEQQFEPKLSSRTLEDGTIVSSPLEDLYPFLSPEELASNIIESEKGEN